MNAFPSVKLADIALINPPMGDLIDDAEQVSFLPMSAVDSAQVVVVDSDVRQYAEVKKGYTAFLDGDILVAKITPCFENGKIAHARLSRRYGFGSTEFHVVRADESIADQRFLVRFLRQERIRQEGEPRMTGSAGQRRVPSHFLANLDVRLPPLPEQRRIADILDMVDALRAKRRAALAQLETLKQAVFLEMFGDPARNPKSWPTVVLGEHTTKIGSGATPHGGEAAYREVGITLIRSMNVRDGHFEDAGLAHISAEQAARLVGVTVEADDVLLNITGASVARVCRAPERVLPARVNQHVAIIRPSPSLNPVFLERLMLCDSVKNRLLRVAGAGATREAITKAEIEKFEVISPPIETQDEFSRIIAKAEVTIEDLQASRTQFDSLFSALQHRAFRGEL